MAGETDNPRDRGAADGGEDAENIHVRYARFNKDILLLFNGVLDEIQQYNQSVNNRLDGVQGSVDGIENRLGDIQRSIQDMQNGNRNPQYDELIRRIDDLINQIGRQPNMPNYPMYGMPQPPQVSSQDCGEFQKCAVEEIAKLRDIVTELKTWYNEEWYDKIFPRLVEAGIIKLKKDGSGQPDVYPAKKTPAEGDGQPPTPSQPPADERPTQPDDQPAPQPNDGDGQPPTPPQPPADRRQPQPDDQPAPQPNEGDGQPPQPPGDGQPPRPPRPDRRQPQPTPQPPEPSDDQPGDRRQPQPAPSQPEDPFANILGDGVENNPINGTGIKTYYEAKDKSVRLENGLYRIIRLAYMASEANHITDGGRGIDLSSLKTDPAKRRKFEETMYNLLLKIVNKTYNPATRDIFIDSDTMAGAIGFDRNFLRAVVEQGRDKLVFDEFMKAAVNAADGKISRLRNTPYLCLDESLRGEVVNYTGTQGRVDPNRLEIPEMGHLLDVYKDLGSIPNKVLEGKKYAIQQPQRRAA